MKISLIYAQNEDGAIGYAGPRPLPWHHPEDLERFKKLTQGKPICMGSATFDSLPRILPGRFHYVLTSREGLPRLGRLDRVQFLNSLDAVLEEMQHHNEKELFVIGGADVLTNAMKKADTIYRTTVLNHPLSGNVAKVPRNDEDDPVWDDFVCVERESIGSELIFETWKTIRDL